MSVQQVQRDLTLRKPALDPGVRYEGWTETIVRDLLNALVTLGRAVQNRPTIIPIEGPTAEGRYEISDAGRKSLGKD